MQPRNATAQCNRAMQPRNATAQCNRANSARKSSTQSESDFPRIGEFSRSTLNRLMGNVSCTPQLEEYTAAQAGQTATYWLRWVSTRGDKGPWSELISATIPG